MRAVRAQHEITLEMMQCIQRIIHFVIVTQRELVMDLSTSWAVIERGFVKIDCAQEVSLRRLPIGVFNELRVARSHHPIAATKTAGGKDRQANACDTRLCRQCATPGGRRVPELVSARHCRQCAY